MLRMKKRYTAKDLALIAIFYLLLLQNPLEQVHPLFAYIDELFGFIGIGTILYQGIREGKLVIKKSSFRMILALAVFFAAGIMGNLIYRYQPLQAVLIDIYTNLKFFLAVLSGYVLFQNMDLENKRNVLLTHAKLAATVFFVLLVLDLAFQIFPNQETRYGLRVVQLSYSHPTYLAGTAVFLLSVLTVFYRRQNLIYIVMSLLVLFFTLRGKAIAGVAVYCLIFYFILIYRKKLRFWHLVLIALVALAVAGEQVAYYYIELEGRSARSALTQTAIAIAKDYFPIGTGFGTFASSSAAEYYSPVYLKYGLNNVHGLSIGNTSFGSDTFWPIILGQTGAVGTAAYIVVLAMLFLRLQVIRKISISAYAAGIFVFGYLMISSTSEPAFSNAISVPLAMLLGYILTLEKHRQKRGTI